MDYIVRTFGIGCDEVECSTYENAFSIAREVVGEIKVVVTRPDGIVDIIGCICMDEAKKYMRRYNARGWSAYIQTITTDCEG